MIKTVNIIFLIAFLLSALVQYNDPDPWRWLAIYFAAAGMCLLQHFNKLHRYLPLALVIICSLWVLLLVPNILGEVNAQEVIESITMKSKAVEEAREIGGLTLILFWSGVLAYLKYGL